MPTRKRNELWGILWRSNNRIDGRSDYLIWGTPSSTPGFNLPILFRTRAAARAFIEARYGYIRERTDLRAAYGWRMPIPVKVRLDYDR